MNDLEKNSQIDGILYLVSTPIGNDDDITQRALKVLKNCDLVVCEEAKIGARILKRYNISKEIEILNEQNELEFTPNYLAKLKQGLKIALISDCGTPVFADPGIELVKVCINANIEVVVVPGVSSIMTALVRSGLPCDGFIYSGFLSRDGEKRFQQLKSLRDEAKTVVMLETPYRLMPVLEAAAKLMPARNAYIGCNLTMPFETHHYGTFQDLFEKFKNLKFKGEFVIVFAGDPFRIKAEQEGRKWDERPSTQLKLNIGNRIPTLKLRTQSSERSDNRRDERPTRFSKAPFNKDRSFDRKKRSDFNSDWKPERKERKSFNDDRPSYKSDRKPFNKDFKSDPGEKSGRKFKSSSSDGGKFAGRSDNKFKKSSSNRSSSSRKPNFKKR